MLWGCKLHTKARWMEFSTGEKRIRSKVQGSKFKVDIEKKLLTPGREVLDVCFCKSRFTTAPSLRLRCGVFSYSVGDFCRKFPSHEARPIKRLFKSSMFRGSTSKKRSGNLRAATQSERPKIATSRVDCLGSEPRIEMSVRRACFMSGVPLQLFSAFMFEHASWHRLCGNR